MEIDYKYMNLDVLRDAGEHGDSRGWFLVGYILAKGLQGTVDEEEALACFVKAAQMGHTEAAYDAALLYARKACDNTFPEEYFPLMLQAAEGGYPAAQALVGNHYEHGNGVAENQEKAVY